MNIRTAMILLFVFFAISVKGQYKFYSYNAHNSVKEAIIVSVDVIKARTLDFEKKAEKKPLMFHQAKRSVGELNRLSNNLSFYIEKLQKEVDTERVLYDLLDEDFYKKLLFTQRGNLTSKGNRLKIKIDSLYNLTPKINIHGLTHLSDFAENHFKTDADYYDGDENKISYFDRLFYDKSNYGMMMSMNYLLLDVKTFQLLFYGTVMSY